MFRIRNEQFNALRKQSLGDGLIRTFQDSKQEAFRDHETGDILVKDPKGNTTRFGFDDKGFVGAVISPSKRTWRLENDKSGKLLGLTNPSGLRSSFEYNSEGELSA